MKKEKQKSSSSKHKHHRSIKKDDDKYSLASTIESSTTAMSSVVSESSEESDATTVSETSSAHSSELSAKIKKYKKNDKKAHRSSLERPSSLYEMPVSNVSAQPTTSAVTGSRRLSLTNLYPQISPLQPSQSAPTSQQQASYHASPHRFNLNSNNRISSPYQSGPAPTISYNSHAPESNSLTNPYGLSTQTNGTNLTTGTSHSIHGEEEKKRGVMFMDNPVLSNESRRNSSHAESKAVLSALKDLQQKLTRTEEEKNFYKQNYEMEQQKFVEYKLDTEKLMSSEKLSFLKEREELQLSKSELMKEVAILRDSLKSLEGQLQYFKQATSNNDVERKLQQERVINLEKNSHELDILYKESDKRVHELETFNKNAQNKIDELQQNLVKERRRKEKIEEEKLLVDRALKEMVMIHQSLFDKKAVVQQSSTTTAVVKKKKKETGLAAAPSTTATTTKRPKSASIHDRLKKANKNQPIPFVAGETENYFNVNSRTQRNLNIGLEFDKEKDEEPYNYYPTNMDLNLLDDIDPNKEIHRVIEELEEEYSYLNKQYHDLLTNLNSSKSMVNSEGVTSQLKLVLDQMDRKSKQLQYLRRYQQVMQETLREATSPPKVRGMKKRVKTLQLFRDLKNV